jgi:phosphoribosylamine--glycine ligase
VAKVLIVGSGAREHALGRAMAGAHTVVTAPGNAGTATIGQNAAVRADDVEGLVALARAESVDLAVVGPEAPLVLGLVDALQAAGVRAFGPTRAAARLEGSKAFMKQFLTRRGIATAPYRVFDDPDEAGAYVRAAPRPPVVKADGLCAGKGVVLPETTGEALEAIDGMMRRRVFGEAGRVVVLEERLGGEEASFHAVSDGERVIALAPAQDHKRVGDGDRGPNTGGMGAYAPAPIVTSEVAGRVMREIVEPTIRGMREEGAPFRGALFVGLMIEAGVPRVLEFNVRFGDPETSVLVPLMRGDWFALLDGAARGDLSAFTAPPAHGAALSVVMAAEGYPGTPRTGDAIDGLDRAARGGRGGGVFVLHAGTARKDDGTIVTAGGRVLAVGASAETLETAARSAYAAVSEIHFRGEHHRSDIGHRALRET